MSRVPDVAARRISYRNLAVWITYGVIAGPVGAVLVFGTRQAIDLINRILLSTALPLPVLAIAGAVLVSLSIYKGVPDAAGEGIPSYLRAMRGNSRFPAVVTLLKLPAAILTLGFYGSGGVVGPVGRVSAGIMSLLAPGDADNALGTERRHIAAVCGMAAGVGAVFHAPIGGGIFAVEIIQRANMRYRDLFPAIIAASVSVLVMDGAGWDPLIRIAPLTFGSLGDSPQEIGNAIWILLFALCIGLLSGIFVRGYTFFARIFKRGHGAVWLKVSIGMGAGALIMVLASPDLAGVASAATDRLAHGVLPSMGRGMVRLIPVAALILLIARSTATFLTVGSGMNAGLTGPAVQAGMIAAIGAAAAVSEFSDASLLPVFLVVGFSGMLAGAMNVPIAAAILGVEVFGRDFGVAAALASVIAFQLNRGTMIYDVALDSDSEMDE